MRVFYLNILNLETAEVRSCRTLPGMCEGIEWVFVSLSEDLVRLPGSVPGSIPVFSPPSILVVV